MDTRTSLSRALERFQARPAEEPRRRDLPGDWKRPRGAWQNIVYLWRTSLPFRTIAHTVAYSSVTVLCVGLIMSNSIANDLFQTRVQQVLQESGRSATQAQQVFNSGNETDVVALTSLREEAMASAAAAAPNSLGYAFERAPGTNPKVVLQDIASAAVDVAVVSDDMKKAVGNDASVQRYQAVRLATRDGGTVPGLVVGTSVNVPSAGPYQLYLVYSLEEAQRTLDFVQRTLLASMLALVLLIAVIVGLVMRTVIQPIRSAALVSRKLAAGELSERIPETGGDDIATLGRSFNEMADALQQQITALNELSKVQQRFVSDVSHELRTPLTTIRLAGGMLTAKSDEFDPVTRRSVELLYDQIQRFELLLADLLEISRYDAGAVELLRSPNNLVQIAEDVSESLTQVSLDHGTPLVLHAPGGHCEAEFDDRRVTRIVRNLIGNAIEHGEGKPIVISVDSNESAVAISVRDYGVGMTTDQRVRVFDRFWRADPSRKRTMGGTGLGLAISKEDAALHDGQIDVWSEPGKGANFRLTLPRTVGVPINYSPLPLEPDDAGADTYEGEETPPELETFTDEDVDTQPIILPDLVGQSGEETLSGEPVVSTAAIPVVEVAEVLEEAPEGGPVATTLPALTATATEPSGAAGAAATPGSPGSPSSPGAAEHVDRPGERA